MQIIPTEIADVLIVEPRLFEDERGFFMETFQARLFAQAGIEQVFVQDNHSRSIRSTLRGLHYQVRHAQGKLVRVVAGEVFDVAVDLRRSSPTFGKTAGIVLSAQNKRQVWLIVYKRFGLAGPETPSRTWLDREARLTGRVEFAGLDLLRYEGRTPQ